LGLKYRVEIGFGIIQLGTIPILHLEKRVPIYAPFLT